MLYIYRSCPVFYIMGMTILIYCHESYTKLYELRNYFCFVFHSEIGFDSAVKYTDLTFTSLNLLTKIILNQISNPGCSDRLLMLLKIGHQLVGWGINKLIGLLLEYLCIAKNKMHAS